MLIVHYLHLRYQFYPMIPKTLAQNFLIPPPSIHELNNIIREHQKKPIRINIEITNSR